MICVVMFAVILAVKALEHSTIPLPASDRWVLRMLFMLPNYISLMVGFFLFTEVREENAQMLFSLTIPDQPTSEGLNMPAPDDMVAPITSRQEG